MYNAFIADYDAELNQVFAEFKTEGVIDLILDLRYNSGGHVISSVHLSSMILGSNANGKLFAKERWNSKLQPYMEKERGTNNLFTSTLTTSNNTPISHLNVSKIYILTTNRTASASELVINGLKPYIDVIQIGTATTGKNVGSITLYDYLSDKKTRNPNHKWAMQPLTFKIENANGVGEYTNGLQPTYYMEEDFANYGFLGDENEPFLAKALQLITGNTDKHLPIKAQIPIRTLVDSNTFNIGTNGMYK